MLRLSQSGLLNRDSDRDDLEEALENAYDRAAFYQGIYYESPKEQLWTLESWRLETEIDVKEGR